MSYTLKDEIWTENNQYLVVLGLIMSNSDEASKDGGPKIADKDWEREVGILKLLAKGRKISSVAGQYRENDRWIIRLRNKAATYPASLIVLLPLEVQDYLVKINRKNRPELKSEIERIRLVKSTGEIDSEALLRKKAKVDHKNDLSEAAQNLVNHLQSYWPYTWPTDQTIAEIAVENDELDLVRLLKKPPTQWLFSHMQIEFPELQSTDKWDNLKVREITERIIYSLSLRAA